MSNARRQQWLLGAVLASLLVTIWVQPAGSPLVEHDETRYAEIAREMLSGGDYTVPHLDGVAWYEKPPMLFWTGAVSMRIFGATPWAARFPTRLAGLATIGLLYLWVAGETDRRRGLLASVVAAGTPLGWGIAHLNLTDGLLTFFVSSAIVAGYAATRLSSARARVALTLLAGVACGGAFLTKGLIGFLFPAAIVGIWALSVRRTRQFAITAAVSFAAALAVVLPWAAIVAKQSPDYLRVLLIREHFQRYATTIHDREQPILFAAAVFAIALTPVLGTFCAALFTRRIPFSERDRLLIVWFTFIVLFFSFSRSQLASYVAPAIPAASAFIAFRFGDSFLRLGAWIFQAGLTTAAVLALFIVPRTASMLLQPQTSSIALLAAGALLGAVWLAVRLAKRDQWAAIATTFAGCAAVYAAIVVGFPTVSVAREMPALRETIDRERLTGDVEMVTYRTFLRGLPWLMRCPVPFVDPGGEVAMGANAIRDPDSSIAWTERRFWQRWMQGPALMAMIKERDIPEFEQQAGGVPFIIARARQHLLVSNFPPTGYPSRDRIMSTALYGPTPDSRPVPIASVPSNIVASARRELETEAIIRAFIERTTDGYTYELVSGGPLPRLVEIDLAGRVLYTEEQIDERELPQKVVAALGRLAPRLPIVYVTRERPHSGGLDRYEIYLPEGQAVREVEVDASGQLTN